MSQTAISVLHSKTLLTLFGTRDQHVRKICEALDVQIAARDGEIQNLDAQEGTAIDAGTTLCVVA